MSVSVIEFVISLIIVIIIGIVDCVVGGIVVIDGEHTDWDIVKYGKKEDSKQLEDLYVIM